MADATQQAAKDLVFGSGAAAFWGKDKTDDARISELGKVSPAFGKYPRPQQEAALKAWRGSAKSAGSIQSDKVDSRAAAQGPAPGAFRKSIGTPLLEGARDLARSAGGAAFETMGKLGLAGATPEEKEKSLAFQRGFGKGAADLGVDLTSPANLIMMFGPQLIKSGGAVAKRIPRISKAVRFGLSSGFSADLLSSLAEDAPAAYEAYRRGEYEKSGQLYAKSVGELFLGLAAGKHAMKEARTPATKAKATPDAAPPPAAPVAATPPEAPPTPPPPVESAPAPLALPAPAPTPSAGIDPWKKGYKPPSAPTTKVGSVGEKTRSEMPTTLQVGRDRPPLPNRGESLVQARSIPIEILRSNVSAMEADINRLKGQLPEGELAAATVWLDAYKKILVERESSEAPKPDTAPSATDRLHQLRSELSGSPATPAPPTVVTGTTTPASEGALGSPQAPAPPPAQGLAAQGLAAQGLAAQTGKPAPAPAPPVAPPAGVGLAAQVSAQAPSAKAAAPAPAVESKPKKPKKAPDPKQAAAKEPQLSDTLKDMLGKFNATQRGIIEALPFNVKQGLLSWWRKSRVEKVDDPSLLSFFVKSSMDAGMDPSAILDSLKMAKKSAAPAAPASAPKPVKAEKPKPEEKKAPAPAAPQTGLAAQATSAASPAPTPSEPAPKRKAKGRAKNEAAPAAPPPTPATPPPPAVGLAAQASTAAAETPRTRATRPLPKTPGPPTSDAPVDPRPKTVAEMPPFIVRDFDELVAKKRAGAEPREISMLTDKVMKEIKARTAMEPAAAMTELEKTWESRRGESVARSEEAKAKESARTAGDNPVIKPEDLPKITTPEWSTLPIEVRRTFKTYVNSGEKPNRLKEFVDAATAAGVDPAIVPQLFGKAFPDRATRAQASQPVVKENLAEGELPRAFANRAMEIWDTMKRYGIGQLIIQTRMGPKGEPGKGSKTLSLDIEKETPQSFLAKVAKLDDNPQLVRVTSPEMERMGKSTIIKDLGKGVRREMKNTPAPPEAPTPAPPEAPKAESAPEPKIESLEPQLVSGDPTQPLKPGHVYTIAEDLDPMGPFAGSKFMLESRGNKRFGVRWIDEDTGKPADRSTITDLTEDQLRAKLQGFEKPAAAPKEGDTKVGPGGEREKVTRADQPLDHFPEGMDAKMWKESRSFQRKNPNASLQELADHMAKKFPNYSSKAFREFLEETLDVEEAAGKLNEHFKGGPPPKP